MVGSGSGAAVVSTEPARLRQFRGSLPERLRRVLGMVMCAGGQQARACQGTIATPFVFDPREQRSKLSDPEWKSLAGEDISGDLPDGRSLLSRLDKQWEDKVICVPILIRLRHSGTFEVRVTLDVNLDDVVQRLTASSTVKCERSLELSSSIITLPPASSGEPREARCVNVTNVSNIPLQLTGAKLSGIEERGVSSPDETGTMFLS